MRNEKRRVDEQMLKMVEKSMVTEHKKSVKQSIFKEKGSEVSTYLYDRFNKQTQAISSYQSKLKRREDMIEARRNQKEKLQHNDTHLMKRTERNSLRHQDHAENYGQALVAQQKSKQRVLDNHRRLKEVVDMLSTEKTTLADKSVRNTLLLQRLRTSATPDRHFRSLSSSGYHDSPEVK
jgi:hypothetical protein